MIATLGILLTSCDGTTEPPPESDLTVTVTGPASVTAVDVSGTMQCNFNMRATAEGGSSGDHAVFVRGELLWIREGETDPATTRPLTQDDIEDIFGSSVVRRGESLSVERFATITPHTPFQHVNRFVYQVRSGNTSLPVGVNKETVYTVFCG